MESAMESSTSMSTPPEQVDSLIQVHLHFGQSDLGCLCRPLMRAVYNIWITNNTSRYLLQMVADEHGLQLGGMMDGVGSVGNTINIERKLWIKILEVKDQVTFFYLIWCDFFYLMINECNIWLI